MRTTNAIASGNDAHWNCFTIVSPSRPHPGRDERPLAISASLNTPATCPFSRHWQPRMETPETPAPTDVELDRAHGLTLTWDDGTELAFGLEELRVNCPCAECRGLREQHLPVWP